MKNIGFIGCGNMAYALAGAVEKSENPPCVYAYDVDPARVDFFKDSFPYVKGAVSVGELADRSDIIVLAVKPQVIDSVLDELASCEKIVVSIAAGIGLDYFKKKMPRASLVRVMPNTPALVNEMAAGVSFSEGFSPEDKAQVMEFLTLSGTACIVEENLMDAVTGISGSGPAFVARLIGAFIDAGKEAGLSEEIARDLVLTTFSGTTRLLKEKDMSVEDLVVMVSSPGGTTVAGRGVLEASSYREIVQETVMATMKRSRELGK